MKALTNKEQQILSLVSSGMTTKEIANHLNVSHHTVESHRKSLLKKCDAKNTAELVFKNIHQNNFQNTVRDSLYTPLV